MRAEFLNPAWIIARKRDGHELSRTEIEFMIGGFTQNEIPDYQMSAWAMAIFLRGMTVDETAALTDAMLNSGTRIPRIGALPWVDKHSTGGIGDKVSLVLAPWLACCGLRVPMISGRGLGATGGTLDKLESIPGFRTNLSIAELSRVLDRVGCVITGASAEIAPADRRLYALRDVTATVPSIPLITASIMSKKLAESLDALVLDVKHGSGAFMKTQTDAQTLAKSLVDTGRRLGVKTSALLTDMNQPLGRMVGNAVEVDESIAALEGRGPADLLEVTYALGAEMILATGRASSHESAIAMLAAELQSGRARAKFEEMVRAQGGDLEAGRRVSESHVVCSNQQGFVQAIDAESLGLAVIEMGGGRKVASDPIDFSVGFEMLVRIADAVDIGSPIFRVFADQTTLDRVKPLFLKSLTIGFTSVKSPTLVQRFVE